MKLQGKVAGVTGGGAGFGRAIAVAFAREGADVAICDLDGTRAESTASEVRSLGRHALTRELDVTNTPGLQAFVDSIAEELGKIDIWVGNVGMNIKQPSEELWRRLMDVNVNAMFFGAQAAGHYMLRQGSGSIINIASLGGSRVLIDQVAYSTSKAAVIMMTRSLAVDWAGRGVRANTISPSYADTEMFWGKDPQQRQAKCDRLADFTRKAPPTKRLITVEEVAAAAVFLASDGASGVSGLDLIVDRGYGWRIP